MDDITAFLPTKAKPGSEEKIRVMEMRHRLRIPLFDSRDARIDRNGRMLNTEGTEDGTDNGTD